MTTDARALAIDAYNKAQDLLYSDRSPEQDTELLTLAFVSKHFWKQAGGNMQFAISDWLISRVFGELGFADLAVEFAVASLAYEDKNFPYWTKASLCEGAARAFKNIGMDEECSRHIELAKEYLAFEESSADAAVIADQLKDL
jgi:hypothetical protein